jgi:hypothetical protein
VSNAAGSTITLGGALTLSGAYATTLNIQGTTTLTFPTVGTMATISGTETFTNKMMTVTAAPGTDHTATGFIIPLTAHENQAFGDVCYIASDGQAQIAKADAIANANGIVMALATISAGASGNYLLIGSARDDTWNWTVGGLIYLSTTGTTGNTLTQTAPSGANNVIQILGVATHADYILFNANLVQVEHT